jgi:putative SOS response-associated peptidase YedK
VGGAHLSLAGLWEQWNDRLTFAIITVPANPLLATIHERMPAILSAEDARAWIETGDAALLKPYPRDDLSMWPVSRRVNAPRNNDSSLVEAIAEPAPEPRDSARNNGEKPESPQFSFPF